VLLEAETRNEVSGCAVGIGFLVEFVHRNSRSPDADEKALARQCVRAGWVYVEQVHEARAGGSRRCEAFGHMSDERARERIVQIDEQWSSRPSKLFRVLVDHANLCLWFCDAAPSRDVSLRDKLQFFADFHADNFPEWQFRRKQKRTAFARSYIDEAVGFDPS
jgi:hypothetical protein